MPTDRVRVVVIYEDKAHDMFLRRLVERLKPARVRYEPCVDSTRVLRRIGIEVDALRSQRHQENLGLMIVIDADAKGLAGRCRELEQCVKEGTRNGQRRKHERVAFIVPALEIENWYVHLCSAAARPIDELKDYKRTAEWRVLAKDLGLNAKLAVAAWDRQQDRIDPPSIEAARVELERLA